MRLRKVTHNDPAERLAVSVRQSTMQMLDEYQAHYARVYGETIERSQLVEEVLRDYMTNDKAFMKARQPQTNKPTAPKSAPASPAAVGSSDSAS